MAAINHPDGGRFQGYGKPKMTLTTRNMRRRLSSKKTAVTV